MADGTLTTEGAVATTQARSRPTWAEIDVEAITHNARVLSRLVHPAKLCAVVKARGYGHGAPVVARAALAGGAVGLAVALVDEGVELRQNDVDGPVLLLSECSADAVDAAMAYGLTPTVYTAEGIKLFSRGARMLGQRTSVHIKVDTGMHRLGFYRPSSTILSSSWKGSGPTSRWQTGKVPRTGPSRCGSWHSSTR
jgi:alanine racemase